MFFFRIWVFFQIFQVHIVSRFFKLTHMAIMLIAICSKWFIVIANRIFKGQSYIFAIYFGNFCFNYCAAILGSLCIQAEKINTNWKTTVSA